MRATATCCFIIPVKWVTSATQSPPNRRRIPPGPFMGREYNPKPVKNTTKSTLHYANMTKRTHFQKPLLETILEESSATQSQQHKKTGASISRGPGETLRAD